MDCLLRVAHTGVLLASLLGTTHGILAQTDSSALVTVRGTVTFVEPDWYTLILQRADGPLFITIEASTSNLAAGDRVVIQGEWDNESRLSLRALSVTKERQGELPPPLDLDAVSVPLDEVDMSPASMSGWVYRKLGVDERYAYLELAGARFGVQVALPRAVFDKHSEWIGKHVRVTGALLASHSPPEFFATAADLTETRVTDGRTLHGIVVTADEQTAVVKNAQLDKYHVRLRHPAPLAPHDYVEISNADQPPTRAGTLQLLGIATVKPLGKTVLSPRPNTKVPNSLKEFVGMVTSWMRDGDQVQVILKANGQSFLVTGDYLGGATPRLGDLLRIHGVARPSGDEHTILMPSISLERLHVPPRWPPHLAVPFAGIALISTLLIVLWKRHSKDQSNFQRVVNERLAEISHVGRLDLLADMVGALAHQLNQPLTSVTSFARAAQLIHRTEPDSDELDMCLEQIYDEGMRAGNIIRRIRALSSPRTDKRSRAAINQVIEDVVEIFQVQAATSSDLVELHLAEGLQRVVIDEVQIQQVLLNLLNNAREATEQCVDRAPKITVASKAVRGGQVEVAVTDNGAGIPHEGIFGRYFTTKEDGCGLGLSISKAIVESHHGRISAQRLRPHGSCIRFTLPVAGQAGLTADVTGIDPAGQLSPPPSGP